MLFVRRLINENPGQRREQMQLVVYKPLSVIYKSVYIELAFQPLLHHLLQVLVIVNTLHYVEYVLVNSFTEVEDVTCPNVSCWNV